MQLDDFSPASKSARPNIIMLIRVSGNRQDVLRQKADQKRLEQKYGVNVVRTLELHGVSGTATLDHKDIRRILDELSSPDIDGMGLSALDRLLRPAKRFGQSAMIDRFIEEGKKIWSVREGVVDPDADDGNAKCWQAMGQASAEWREILRRSMDQRLINLDLGMLDHSMAPYGMLNVKTPEGRKLIIDPGMSSVPGITKRQVVEMMYGWRRLGWGITKIVNALNERGILSAGYWGKKDPETGKAKWIPPGLWSRSPVRGMLRNSTYCGEHKRMGRIIKCEAIFSKEFWEEVQRVNETAPKRTTGRAPKHHFLLSNFLFDKYEHRMCSAGSSTRTTADGKEFIRNQEAYRCHHRRPRTQKRICDTPQISCAKIEPVAFDGVWDTITQPKLLLAGTKAYYAVREQNTSATARLEKEAQTLTRAIEGMEEMIEQGAATDPAQTVQKMRVKQKRLREVQADLKEAGKVVFIPSERQAEAATRRIADPKNKPVKFEHRRSILESIQDLKMVYADGVLTIEGAIPMPAETASGSMKSTDRAENKCEGRLDRPHTCLTPIPFRITRRIA